MTTNVLPSCTTTLMVISVNPIKLTITKKIITANEKNKFCQITRFILEETRWAYVNLEMLLCTNARSEHLHRDVGAVAHGNAHVRVNKRGSIVHTVAHHSGDPVCMFLMVYYG